MRCPSCGSIGAPDARFCARCGAALEGAATDQPDADGGSRAGLADPDVEIATGDRRIVTALFADIVDYVRMLAEHDPEVVRARVMTALGTMAEAIERHGGTREKFIGDAVFAVFGWPEAHDDDAVRAALAGLAIRSALSEPRDGVEPLEVRIGIATGEVVTAGRDSAGTGDLGLTGEAITTAARIQSMARPGEILLDGPTRRAARGRLAVEDRGTVVLRGQSTPIELLGLQGEAGLSAWTSIRTPRPGPLVGRDRQRATIVDALQRCGQSGHGETILVVGEAGVGKTRLLRSAEGPARRAGFAWSWTENVSYGRGEPFRWGRLFAQTVADEHHVDSGSYLRQLIFTNDVDTETAHRYGGAIAAIARDAAFTGWESEAIHMPTDPAVVAATLSDIAHVYLERLLSTEGPRVIIVDDLHWLDSSSFGMIEEVVDAVTRYPALLLASTRPGTMPAWIDRPSVTRLDLDGLSEPETARLATLVAKAAVDADGARSIHERTAGNPLFITETVRAFLDDGRLAWRDGRVSLVESATTSLPVTLRAVLGARIDALDSTAAETLRVASVIGIAFVEDDLVALLDRPTAQSTLQGLVDDGLIQPTGDRQWRFAHPLIHDTAYAGLLASRRRALHARSADLLSQKPAVLVPLGQIATHWAAAGDATRALPLLREAAATAMAIGAVAEAAAFWRQAATLAAFDDPEEAAADQAKADAALAAARVMVEAASGAGTSGSSA